MGSLKICLDTRAVAPGAPAPLKLQLNHNHKTALIPLNIKIRQDQWDRSTSTVVCHPQKKILNESIRLQLSRAEIAMHEALGTGKRTDISATELKRMVVAIMNGTAYDRGDAPEGTLFLPRLEAFRDTRVTQGTRGVYQQTLSRLLAFDPELDRRCFEDIDRSYLARFEAFLSKTSKSANARAVHFRNIRAVFNDALDDELITCYPFRKFKIGHAPTRKRSLTAEQLRTLISYSCESYQVIYRDMFVLMFFLCGINAVDLFNAPADAIVNGRLEYVRAKTHKPYSVKVEPEAAEIIGRYRGTRHLLGIMDRQKDYRNFLHKMGDALKQIGPVERSGLGGRKTRHPLFPGLSQYWCRHTWATMAAELDIPKETIAAALGHSANTVTDIYISFNRKKVDAANRKVMDYILYGK